MLKLRQAGATILFLAPGFYHGWERVDQLLDFVVGRALDQLGVENTWCPSGAPRDHADRHALAGRRPHHVRPDRAGLRPDEPADVRRPRPALAPDDRRCGRAPRRPRPRRLLRHGRSRRSPARLPAASSPAWTSPSGCSSAPGVKSSTIEWIRGDVLELPFEEAAFDAATVGFGIRNVADLHARPGGARPRRCARAAGSRSSRSRSRAASCGRSTSSGSTASCRSPASSCPAARPTAYLPASVRRFPGPDELAGLLARTGFQDVRYRLLAGGIVALHTGERRDG